MRFRGLDDWHLGQEDFELQPKPEILKFPETLNPHKAYTLDPKPRNVKQLHIGTHGREIHRQCRGSLLLACPEEPRDLGFQGVGVKG